MLQQVGVVLHLGDAVQLADDALLGELHDLHALGLEVVNRHGESKLCWLRCSAVTVLATGVVRPHLGFDVVGLGILGEAERLERTVIGFAPALVKLKRLIAQQCKAHAAAGLNLGGVEITTTSASSDC